MGLSREIEGWMTDGGWSWPALLALAARPAGYRARSAELRSRSRSSAGIWLRAKISRTDFQNLEKKTTRPHFFPGGPRNCLAHHQLRQNGAQIRIRHNERLEETLIQQAFNFLIVLIEEEILLGSQTRSNATQTQTRQRFPQKSQQTLAHPLQGIRPQTPGVKRHPTCGSAETSESQEGEAIHG